MTEAIWDQLMVILIMLLGTSFGVLNGMNDVSGLLGTVCSSRALKLFQAQCLAILGIWLGIWFGTDAVSRTVCLGLVQLATYPESLAVGIWLSALGGALCWGMLARHYSIPSSATHSFIGAICGATLLGTLNFSAVNWTTGVSKVFLGLIMSPLLGGTLGYLAFRLLVLCLRQASAQVFRHLRRGERVAVFFQSICYGLNDAHGLMGLLMGAALSAHIASVDPAHFQVNWPIKVLVGVSISSGALLGSSGMLRALARGIYLVRPPEALAAQSAAAMAVFSAAALGLPVSSSQVNSSALIGVGGAWRPRHVRWRKVWSIGMTWVITFPASFCLGALVCALVIGLEKLAVH